MKLTQEQKSQIIDQINSFVKRVNIRFDSRYILSLDEQKALPKMNQWERDFLNNIRCGLQYDQIHSLSEKQVNCLNKILNR